MSRRRAVLRFVLALSVALVVVPSRGAAAAESDAHTLARDSTLNKRWYFGWLAFLGAATGVNATLWATSGDPDQRAQARMGTIIGGIGIVAQGVFAPPALLATLPEVDPDASDAERSAALAARADLLARRADAEAFGRSVLAHLGGIVLNGAGGLYLWLHDDLPARAAFLFGSGVLVSELIIWTQPTTAMTAHERARVDVSVAPLVLKGGAGLSIAITY